MSIGDPQGLFPLSVSPVDVEVHPDGYAVWNDRNAFYFATINVETGEIGEILTVLEVRPQPLSNAWQGPEFIETEDGLFAVGSAHAGIVLFSAEGGEVLEGTKGYNPGFTPGQTMPTLIFNISDEVEEALLYKDGEIVDLGLPEEVTSIRFMPWLSTTEMIVELADGYALFDIETKELTEIVSGVTPRSLQSAAHVDDEGKRMALLYGTDGSMLYVDGSEEWVLDRILTSPFAGYAGFRSAEFFEWHGRTWISGLFSETHGENTVLALYDIENDEWVRLSNGDSKMIDPETFVLDDGDLAVYYSFDNRQYFLEVDAMVALPLDELAEPTLLEGDSSIDIEVNRDGYAVWQDRDSFRFSAVDTETGELISVLNTVDIRPVPLEDSLQGPEFIETVDGLFAVGNSRQGIVIYSATGHEVIPETRGWGHGYTPIGILPELRFNLVDRNGNPYLYRDGELTPLSLPEEVVENQYLPWLSGTELVVELSDGYGVYDIETEDLTEIVTGVTDPKIGQSGAYLAPDGDRYALLWSSIGNLIYVDRGDGWELDGTIISPYEDYASLRSPEFFQWRGKTWLAGFLSEIDERKSILVLYDLDNDRWIELSDGDTFIVDPEAFVLDNGDLVIYYAVDSYGDKAQYRIVLDNALAKPPNLPADDAEWFFGQNVRYADIEVHPSGHAIYAGKDAFFFGTVDMNTGKFGEVLNAYPALPLPFIITNQGPEFIETDDGLQAIGVAAGGITLFDAESAELLPNTEGMQYSYTPNGNTGDLVFSVFTLGREEPALYTDGEFLPLDFRAPAPWLSTSEMLVQINDGSYVIYDITTERYERLTEETYLLGSNGLSAGYTADNGTQMALLYGGRTMDLHIDDGGGWELDHTLVSPFRNYAQFWSLEFTEWNGDLWVSGFLQDGDDDGRRVDTMLALYNIDKRAWMQLSDGKSRPIDPEPLVLDTGELAIYYAQNLRTFVFTVSPDEIDLVGAPVPRSNTPDPTEAVEDLAAHIAERHLGSDEFDFV